MTSLLFSLLPLLLAYVLGSIPFGLLLAKIFCKIDPRKSGSCNIGATNVARLCGKKWGFLALFFDLSKGVFAVFVVSFLVSTYQIELPYAPQLAGFAAIFGHMFPLFLGFKGGKGVATTVGVYLALSPLPFLVSGAICVLIIWKTSYVSAGSLALVTTLPLFLFFTGDLATCVLSLVTGSFVIYAHRENIKRLIRRQEKPWTGKNKE